MPEFTLSAVEGFTLLALFTLSAVEGFTLLALFTLSLSKGRSRREPVEGSLSKEACRREPKGLPSKARGHCAPVRPPRRTVECTRLQAGLRDP